MNINKLSSNCFLCAHANAIYLDDNSVDCRRSNDGDLCSFDNIGVKTNVGELFIHLYKYIDRNFHTIDPFGSKQNQNKYHQYQMVVDEFSHKTFLMSNFRLNKSTEKIANLLQLYSSTRNLTPLEAGILYTVFLIVIDGLADEIQNEYWTHYTDTLPVIFHEAFLHVRPKDTINKYFIQRKYKQTEVIPKNSLDQQLTYLTVMLPEQSRSRFLWKSMFSYGDKVDFPPIEQIKIQTNTLGVVALEDLEKNITECDPAEGKSRFWFSGHKNLETLKANIKLALQQAIHDKANILIFPELTIPPVLKDWLSDQIFQTCDESDNKIHLIVAGSFHEVINGGSDAYKCNISYIYNYKGKELFRQSKREKFILTENNLPKLVEDLHDPFHKYVVFDFPLGRLLVLICADFPTGRIELSPALRGLGVNLIFVPAYTKKLSGKFVRSAEHFGETLAATTIVSNSHSSEHAALRYIPFILKDVEELKEFSLPLKNTNYGQNKNNTFFTVIDFANFREVSSSGKT